jgi:dephospho-CoA kinase
MSRDVTTYRLGLTGSVGMGKSTTAALFEEAGVPVWDADAAVHRLYASAAGAAALGAIAPDSVVGGRIDRARLRAAVAADPSLLDGIEAEVHPLVAADRAAFAGANAGAPLVVFDIPLLYETGAERELDGVLVVSAPASVQRARVLARPGMTPEAFERVLARQLPDGEKRARADFVIDTGRGLDAARADVLTLIDRITAGQGRRTDA